MVKIDRFTTKHSFKRDQGLVNCSTMAAGIQYSFAQSCQILTCNVRFLWNGVRMEVVPLTKDCFIMIILKDDDMSPLPQYPP